MPKLSNMRLPQKFMILGFIVLLAVALPTSLYLSNIIADLETAKQEAAGVTPIVALQHVIQLTQQHRGMSAGMLNGDSTLSNRMPAIQAKLANALNILDTTLKESGASSQIISGFDTIKQHLETIKTKGRQSSN